MNSRLNHWAESFDALTVRERVLILVTLLVAMLLPTFMYVIEPAQKEQLKLTTDIARQKAANANKQVDISMLSASKQTDPNIALRSQIEARRQQLTELNRTLKERSSTLVSPRRMLGLLEQVLSEHPGLSLISVSKAEPRRFGSDTTAGPDSTNTDNATGNPEAESLDGLYRHDLSLVIEGGFFDVLAYLQALEQLPGGFFWDGIDYQVGSYPDARVSLQVHTLSTEQGWLGV